MHIDWFRVSELCMILDLGYLQFFNSSVDTCSASTPFLSRTNL